MTTVNGINGAGGGAGAQGPKPLLDEKLKNTRLGSVFVAAVNTAKDTSKYNMNNLSIFDTDGEAGLSAAEMKAGIMQIQESNRKTINQDRYRGPQKGVQNTEAQKAAFGTLTTLNDDEAFEFYDWKGRRGDDQQAERTAQVNNNERNAAQAARVMLDKLDEKTLNNLERDAVGLDEDAEEPTETPDTPSTTSTDGDGTSADGPTPPPSTGDDGTSTDGPTPPPSTGDDGTSTDGPTPPPSTGDDGTSTDG
ncbi:hypothetical protein IJE86_11235, partial [bacterium]|nr:hypothetical protein [bacterium]